MKRVISLLLLLCIVAVALAACGGGEEKTTKKTTSTTKPTETNQYGEVEVIGQTFNWDDVKFEDAVIKVLARNDYKVQKEWGQIETADVDGLSVEIEKRNAKVEKDLGVEIQMTYLGDQWAGTFKDVIMSAVQTDFDNGMNAYDIVACYGYIGLQSAYRDLWANLLDKDTFPYFDFSLICWNQGLYKNGTVNGRLYLCSGDFNISLFDSTMIMWHNKDLYEDLLEKTNDTTSPRDLQDTIIAGEWTYSELYKWASYYENKDLESNKGDVFGVFLQGEIYPTQPFDAIPYAWDLQFIKTNADGTHSFNYKDNDRAEKAMTMFRNLWGERGTATETTGGPSFPSGNLLFKGDVIWFSEEGNLALRNMTQRYSLTPWPKFDETQDRYATTSQDYFTTMAVIDHSGSPITTKGEEISAYLQYATEYSYTNVRMFYFKEIVEPKYFGNFTDGTTKKSVAIFNTIINNLQYDFGTIYSGSLNSVVSACWRYNVLLKNGAGAGKELSTSTVFQKYWDNHEAYDNALVELDTWFGLIEK